MPKGKYPCKYKNRTNLCHEPIVSAISTFLRVSICVPNAHFFNYIPAIPLFPFSTSTNYTPTGTENSLGSPRNPRPLLFPRLQTSPSTVLFPRQGYLEEMVRKAAVVRHEVDARSVNIRACN